jgi:tetratricopeptide (TPR) repeat protein
MLEAVTAADPANTGVALLLTNLYLENGQLDEARARLASLPPDAITDPTIYVNIGILFLNKNNPQEALTYFSKGVDLDMTRPESFYYRGLANLQLKKMKEAKTDFQKVLELAPESTEGRDAKQLIDSIK